MLSTDMNNLKYVALEVIKNPGTKLLDVECGAFMGLIVHKNENAADTIFIVLQNSKKSIRMYNTLDYGIVTIQAETPDMKYMTVFTKNDQTVAINTLKQIIAAMRTADRLYSAVPGNELINVDSYVDMPDVVLIGNNLSSSVINHTSTAQGENSFNQNNANNTIQTTDYTTYTPEKPIVLNFKRKGKLPAVDKLLNMRNMVIAIAEKKIDLAIPIPKCDIPNKNDEQLKPELEDHKQITNMVTM